MLGVEERGTGGVTWGGKCSGTLLICAGVLHVYVPFLSRTSDTFSPASAKMPKFL